jgi:predicted ABC-type ATPase
VPNLYIIAGCNGAGKTTASLTILPEMLNCRENDVGHKETVVPRPIAEGEKAVDIIIYSRYIWDGINEQA